MKKIIIILILSVFANVSFSQSINDRSVPFHVSDSTTNFNASLIAGTIIFDEGSNRLWKLTALASGTDNLSTMTKVLLAEAGGGADGNGIYDGSGVLSMNTVIDGVGTTYDLNFVDIDAWDVSAQSMLLGSATNLDLNGNVRLIQGSETFRKSGFDGVLEPTILTSDQTYTLQDGSGTLAFITDIPLPDGNGIYAGSGTVPTSTLATLTDNLTFGSGNLLHINNANSNVGVGTGGFSNTKFNVATTSSTQSFGGDFRNNRS